MTLTVTVHDVTPATVLFNQDGHACTSVSIAEVMKQTLAGGKPHPTPVTVTVRNDSGKVLDQQRLEGAGGTFKAGDGCSWDVTFTNLELRPLYQVTLERGAEHHDAVIKLAAHATAKGSLEF